MKSRFPIILACIGAIASQSVFAIERSSQIAVSSFERNSEHPEDFYIKSKSGAEFHLFCGVDRQNPNFRGFLSGKTTAGSRLIQGYMITFKSREECAELTAALEQTFLNEGKVGIIKFKPFKDPAKLYDSVFTAYQENI